MSYSPEHTARTRRRIVANARRLFKSRGYDGVGIDTIMAEAGLTRGGFYAHFASKEELFAAIFGDDAETPAPGTARPAGDLEALIRRYLSIAHRDHQGEGCPLAALSVDAAAQGSAVRDHYTALLEAAIHRIMGLGGEAVGRERATAVMATLVGGIVLARAVNDQRTSSKILSACRKATRNLANLGGSTRN